LVTWYGPIAKLSDFEWAAIIRDTYTGAAQPLGQRGPLLHVLTVKPLVTPVNAKA